MRVTILKSLLALGLAALLVACAGYTQSGVKSSSQESMDGGSLTVEIDRANGTAEESFEVQAGADLILEADVTLAVGLGSYKIELLGENDAVTLTLEARDGETVEGHGQMFTDSFGEASYRVSAANAENVDYQIVYTFR
jgi:hypothetical protein